MKEGHLRAVLIILSLMGVALILMGTSRYGAGVSPDAVNYISVAKSLLSGNGYLLYGGAPLVLAPPLFPTILALLGLIGIEPLIGARFLNAIIFGSIILISGRLFRIYVRSNMLVMLGAVAVLLSVPLLQVSIMAWTEPLFILLVVLFFFCLQRLLSEARVFPFFLISVLAALSCLQRYAGIALVMTGFVIIIFSVPKNIFLHKLKCGIIFCAVSCTPIFIWFIRNYIFTSTLTGYRPLSSYTLRQNIFSMLDVLTNWFVPHEIPFLIRVAGMGLIVSALAILILFSRYSLKRHDEERVERPWAEGVFVLVYLIFLIFSQTRFTLQLVDYRYLAPVYIFIILFMLVGAEDISCWWNARVKNKKPVDRIIIFAFCFWLIYPFVGVVSRVSDYIKNGAGGYNTVAWRESPLVEWLKTHPLDGTIYSNAADAVYFFTNRKAQWSPFRSGSWTAESKREDLLRFKETLTLDKKAYLVWFDIGERGMLYDIRDLRSAIELKRVTVFTDGAVYLLK